MLDANKQIYTEYGRGFMDGKALAVKEREELQHEFEKTYKRLRAENEELHTKLHAFYEKAATLGEHLVKSANHVNDLQQNIEFHLGLLNKNQCAMMSNESKVEFRKEAYRP